MKDRAFGLGDRVTKTKGSSWTGKVVGFYSTTLTPVGYAVESENEPGSVQIYPEAALESTPAPVSEITEEMVERFRSYVNEVIGVHLATELVRRALIVALEGK